MVVVDNFCDEGNLSGEGIRFEKDDCLTESGIVSGESTMYLAQP